MVGWLVYWFPQRSVGFLGNVVSLWEALADEAESEAENEGEVAL